MSIAKTRINVEFEAGDTNKDLKIKCLSEAVTLITQRGISLPELTFYLSSNEAIQNIAFMGGANGKSEANIFLGGKYWNAPTKSRPGVANQIYDGTQRWFGNPRQKAFGTTLVVHEIGHILHEIREPDLFWGNKMGITTQPRANVWGEAAVKVSAYAVIGQTTCLEFVAECFAGVIMGKTYDRMVRNAYTDCGGPAIPNF